MGKRRRRTRQQERARATAIAHPAADWTLEDWRRNMDRLSDHLGDYQGIPVPVADMRVRLARGHPLEHTYPQPVPEVRVAVGGPPRDDIPADATAGEIVRACIVDTVESGERLVNEWYDGRRNRDVLIIQRANGRAFALTLPRAPDRSMERLTLAISTLGASDAWSLKAEATAIEKLATHVTERQLRQFILTGAFLETSRRSALTYMFRRLRPTIALSPRGKRREDDHMRCLAVLCLHPIGFYDRTWAGCMTPTDDVLAHLLLMRGDEAGFWRQANQHEPSAPEAGI